MEEESILHFKNSNSFHGIVLSIFMTLKSDQPTTFMILNAQVFSRKIFPQENVSKAIAQTGFDFTIWKQSQNSLIKVQLCTDCICN